MVNVVIMKPFGISDNSLVLESEALRDSSTLAVSDGSRNCDTIQPKDLECLVYQSTATPRHDSLSNVIVAQPVTYLY